ncbi:bifunctional precorrin-2 dehydrogenase/sirohydrochlorin ferrochelatase [uncultured Desulfuromonas sp.]|uniref:precorrin-2 dehydrogenase/sirohydrochlorin ferrochelatase family protein n=1 Tax=uncultured Desulfuromonas sp. TaxID=181013 RepID=UPI00260DCD35|nr:bifunctional precorrin-2 dehydrogenase/sirohydrochlorin ferrochelatase [uncultured Desulfuromonas sp.]
MTDYPVTLQIADRLCLVVGGGAVGLRKARGLLEAGARVRLVSDTPPLHSPPKGTDLVLRPFRTEDLEGAFLAFAATDDPQINAAVAEEARRRGILVNVCDDPRKGDFHLPALLRRDDLTVAVSTTGKSPALAALARDRAGQVFGPEWGTVLEVFAAVRRKRLTHQKKNEYNQAILRRLLDSGLPGLIAAGNAADIDRLLETLFGEGFSLTTLEVRMPKGTS